MKTKFLFAALATAAMAACSTDEVIDVNKGNAISFRTSVDKATRTTIYSNSSLMDKFKVTAIGNSATYFSDLEVTGKTENNTTTWTPASTYYWPIYSLDFYAYAPTDLNSTSGATVSIDNSSQNISDFQPNSDVSKQQDLVVALAKSKTTTTSAVALNFKHALSQVDVQAKCSNENVTVKVLGVKFVNIGTKATLTFSANEQNDIYSWGTTSETAAYMSGVSSAVTLTSTAASIMGDADHFLMIPQTLTAATSLTTATQTGAYISVLCQVSVKQGGSTSATQIFPQTADKYAFAAVPISGTWEAGKKYTYTLNYGDGSSEYGGGCGVVDPTQKIPDNSGYSAPENATDFENAGTAGNNILGAISFSVSVEDWDSSSDGTSVTTNM